jgi:hypothetical protein
MINFKHIKSMLSLQQTMNITVNPDWVSQGYDWFRAAMLEGAESVEHHGWKWWKAQKKDLPQLQMEIVDIWHFYLSVFLVQSNADQEKALDLIEQHYEENLNSPVIFDNKIYDLSSMTLLSKLDLLIGLSAAKRVHIPLLLSLITDCEMTWEYFFEQYVKKNILNIFRQKNGYKQGTYLKEWFDKEDNISLMEQASKLNPKDDNYVELLWNSLEKTYSEALDYQKNK